MAVDGGELYVATGCGVVLTIDGTAGNVRWAVQYERSTGRAIPQNMGIPQLGGFTLNGWDEDVVIPRGRALILNSQAPGGGFEVTHARVFAIAGPAMLANLTTPLLGIVGTAVIGRLGQAHLLGGVAMSALVFDCIFWLFGFLRMGTVALKNSTRTIEWQAASVSQDGHIDFSKVWPDQKRAIAFAYAELESPARRLVAATVGIGNNIQLRLNGSRISPASFIPSEMRCSSRSTPMALTERGLRQLRKTRTIQPPCCARSAPRSLQPTRLKASPTPSGKPRRSEPVGCCSQPSWPRWS